MTFRACSLPAPAPVRSQPAPAILITQRCQSLITQGNEQKEFPTSDRKPNKGKEQDHLKKTSLGPLKQGQRLDTSGTKQSSSKERKTTKAKLEKPQTTKSSP
jgi:hypothetical protein